MPTDSERSDNANGRSYRMAYIPEEAARAANIMLDALIGQQSTSSPERNILAYELALEPLEHPHSDLDLRIDDSHIMGAALMNQAWLASQLSQATGTDYETTISTLREFIRTLPNTP